jgi:hypothetical protein
LRDEARPALEVLLALAMQRRDAVVLLSDL